MNIKRVVIIVCSVFLGLVALAVCVSARFSLSNITSDLYAFILKFFDQWSLALSAAGTIILAISVFAFISENRRREEREKLQVIHALHNEIHWNLRPIITLRFDISEWFKLVEEGHLMPTETEGLYRQIETRVFDDMRNRGQLHWLEELRMDVVFCYSLIDIYNLDRHFKPEHLELLTKLYECLDKAIRALEAKFKFLPLYMRYGDTEGTTEDVTNETSHLSKQGKSDNVLKSNLNNQKPILLKPLPWGVLLFSFWITLRIVDSPTLLMKAAAWFVLALSGILLVSVLLRPLFPVFQRILAKHIPRLNRIVNRIVTSKNVRWFFVALVFFTTLIGFPVNIAMNLSKLQGIALVISLIGLACWLIAYLLVLVSISSRIGKVGQILSGIVSAGIIGMGINAFESSVLVGSVLIGIGAISIIIAITKPKYWDLLEMV